jgi:hypothetical protein
MKDTETQGRPPRSTTSRRSQSRETATPIEHDEGNYSDPRYDDSYDVVGSHDVVGEQMDRSHSRQNGYHQPNGYQGRSNGYQGRRPNGYQDRRPNGYHGREQGPDQGYQGREGGYQGRDRNYGGHHGPQRQYQQRHPNGYRPKMLILVTTRDIENEDEVTKRVINYHNPENRQWLSRHSYWALCNNKTVLSGPYVDDEQAESYEDHDIPGFDDQDPE